MVFAHALGGLEVDGVDALDAQFDVGVQHLAQVDSAEDALAQLADDLILAQDDVRIHWSLFEFVKTLFDYFV